MAIDQVHDLQKVYRKILHSMSRPGTVSTIKESAERNDYQLPCYDATLLSVLTLFDAEVTFHVIPENRDDVIEKISEYTLASYTPIHEADFVIVLREAEESEIIRAMSHSKRGSLIDPHASATWIMESVVGIGIEMQPGELILTGPGIKNQTQLQTAITSSIWQARNACVKEYPLGIDLILADEKAQIVCVPRTTKVEMAGVK